MSSVAYNCPCCGAPLEYDAAGGKVKCVSCGNSYEPEALDDMNLTETADGIDFEIKEERFDEGEASGVHAYICSACGAELLTEDTTTATECPYCGSPTILPDRIDGSVKPEMVVPFVVTKEQAQKQFDEYFKGKKLLPNIFENSRNRIAEMRKLYVPYWLFNCEAEGNIVYNAEKRRVERSGEWEITHVDHYVVRRSGSMCFENIPVDGSEKLDNKITESLEPYNIAAAVPFTPAVLTGAMADHADVDAEACEGRVAERVKNSIAAALGNTVNGYSVVTERSRSIHAEGGKVTPVLMPVWLITTEKEGKTYTFAINGQTGKLTCDVPADKKKSLIWGGGVFAGVLAIVIAILMLTEMLGSGTILFAVIAALVAGFAVVGVLKGQLKQAHMQSYASGYTKEGSFRLGACYDRFLYRNTTRRRIETGAKKQ